MATAKKTITAVPAKKASRATASAKAAATAKPAASVKAAAAVKAVRTPKAVSVVAAIKPIKTAFNKTALTAHVAAEAGVEPKVAKAVLAALEATILASVHKKGLGEFTLHGLLKLAVLNVPAKKKRLGKDPFTGEERMFAAKPASVKIKTRALKKLKDAAL